MWNQREKTSFVHSCVCPEGPYVQTGRGVRWPRVASLGHNWRLVRVLYTLVHADFHLQRFSLNSAWMFSADPQPHMQMVRHEESWQGGRATFVLKCLRKYFTAVQSIIWHISEMIWHVRLCGCFFFHLSHPCFTDVSTSKCVHVCDCCNKLVFSLAAYVCKWVWKAM